MTKLKNLRTVDVKKGPVERAIDIADAAAAYISGRGDPDTDCAHARGCAASEAKSRLYVIRRAKRIADMHRNGDTFAMVEDALARIERDDAEVP